jgi:putative ABC transport system substrate-binding protein
MKRRKFITLLGGAAAWPVLARGQQVERMRRVGVLMGYAETDTAAQAQVAAFRKELQKLGWEDGRNIRIDVRFPGSDAGRVRTALFEVLSLKPDVLVSNSNLVTAAVRAEVRTLPVIFLTVADPVNSGFVNNETRPDSNLTGFANWDNSMSGKWLELFKEVMPQVERVGYMLHPETPASVDFFRFAEARGPALKVKVVGLGVHDADEIERSLTAFAADGNGGLIVLPHAVMFAHRDLIVALAARLRLPALYSFAFYAKAGGLMSYGFDPISQFQGGAGYVDRILRGAKPADLPVQYPTKFQLVVNLKTAKALGIEIPPTLLARADEVIE